MRENINRAILSETSIVCIIIFCFHSTGDWMLLDECGTCVQDGASCLWKGISSHCMG